jgi:ATP-binding cassette, subfamily B, bacterial CvaB/MchF/RaxB
MSFLSGSRRLPVIQQTELAECALACLAMVGQYHGHDIDLAGLRRRFSLSIQGASLSRLMADAELLGFTTRPLRVELGALAYLKLPCILHWNLNHFVVLKSVSAKGIVIHDPARGERKLSLEEASRHVTGVALEIEPGVDFTPIKARRELSLRALFGQVRGIMRATALVMILALILEAFTLVLPLLMKLVIDHVLVTVEIDFLHLLGVGFLCIVAFQAMTVAIRGWVVSALSASMSAQWVSNLFAHLMRLPLTYFEKRHIGGIMSRFGSLSSIQQTVTGGFVETLLNGVTAILVLAFLLVFSPKLTLLVVAAVGIYSISRWLAYGRIRRLNEEQLVLGARQQSRMIESVRAMQAIKLANKQGERRGQVANIAVEMANRQARIERLSSGFRAFNMLMFGVLRVGLVWIGAWLVIHGQWTVGMLVVFLAYAEMFSVRAGLLVDAIVEFKLLSVHAERISDIALEPPESHLDTGFSGSLNDLCISVRGLGFRYSAGDNWVLRDCSFTIKAGESVAIVGPSGCGKSTLAKLLLGLLEPDEGEILVGGVDIRRFGLASYRELFASVMQNDQLLSGSIASNIAFFDSTSTLESIEEAARAAGIHDEVMAMQMGYETLVGDMGSSLSGGQMQRVLMARALYRKPSILLLDEATSHLDLERERFISDRIRTMGITRINIAHRPQTIASADRIIALENGRIRDVSGGDPDMSKPTASTSDQGSERFELGKTVRP